MKTLLLIATVMTLMLTGHAQTVPSTQSPSDTRVVQQSPKHGTQAVKRVTKHHKRKHPPKPLLQQDTMRTSGSSYSSATKHRSHVKPTHAVRAKEFDPAAEKSVDENVIDEELNEEREHQDEVDKIRAEEPATLERVAKQAARERDSGSVHKPK